MRTNITKKALAYLGKPEELWGLSLEDSENGRYAVSRAVLAWPIGTGQTWTGNGDGKHGPEALSVRIYLLVSGKYLASFDYRTAGNGRPPTRIGMWSRDLETFSDMRAWFEGIQDSLEEQGATVDFDRKTRVALESAEAVVNALNSKVGARVLDVETVSGGVESG